MSLSRMIARYLGVCSLGFAIIAGLAGCQVQPLHGSGNGASIAVNSAGNRVEQVVRNELTFRFGGDSVSDPAYRLELDASASRTGLFPRGTDTDFTAQRVSVTATYILKDAKSDAIIKTGTRSAESQIEVTSQYFAQDRATLDAENRASKVVARMIYADISALLANR